MNKKTEIKTERQVNLVKKYIWIVHYLDQYDYIDKHDVTAAEDMDTAYKIMKSYIKSISELNVPSGRANLTIMDEALDELYTHYTWCKDEEGSWFGVENICAAEQVPLYDRWGREE